MLIRSGLQTDFKDVIELFKILDGKHIRNRNDFKDLIDQRRYTDLLNKCHKAINHYLIVAEADNRIIGFGIGRVNIIENHSFLKNQKIGEILYLMVSDHHKKNGVGKSILENLETKLKGKEIERIEMRIYDFNKEAYPEKASYNKKFTIYEKIV